MTVTPQIEQAVLEAKACEKSTMLPWQLTMAQWADESGWGKDCPGNNCFGIKAYPGCYGVQRLETKEEVKGQYFTHILAFATFPDLQSCFEKHAELITAGKPYQWEWCEWNADPERTPEGLARLVCPIYATDETYTDTIIALIREFDAAFPAKAEAAA